MNKTRIPPVSKVRTFVLPLESRVFSQLTELDSAGLHGLDIHNIAENIFMRWVGDHETDFFSRYGLSMQNAQREGYLSHDAYRRRKITVPYGHVFVGFRGLSRYMLEKLPLTEPTTFQGNVNYSPNEFYLKAPEDVIACVLERTTPRFVAEAHREGFFDDDDGQEFAH